MVSRLRSWSPFLLLLFAVACAATNLSRYDPITYKSLTDLRPVAIRTYRSFTESGINAPRTEAFELQLEQLIEYETWKGNGNEEMVEQVNELHAMFLDHLSDRRSNGPWSEAHFRNKLELFLEALQIAIETEAAKNRSRE